MFNHHKVIFFMRTSIFTFLLLSFIFTTVSAQLVDTSPTGRITINTLFNSKNTPKFKPNYEAYKPDEEAIKTIRKFKGKMQIKMIMAFWDEESSQQTSELVKILETAKWDVSDANQLKIFAVNTVMEASFEGFNSLKVNVLPTYIFYVNGKEVGRYDNNLPMNLEKSIAAFMTQYENRSK